MHLDFIHNLLIRKYRRNSILFQENILFHLPTEVLESNIIVFQKGLIVVGIILVLTFRLFSNAFVTLIEFFPSTLETFDEILFHCQVTCPSQFLIFGSGLKRTPCKFFIFGSGLKRTPCRFQCRFFSVLFILDY